MTVFVQNYRYFGQPFPELTRFLHQIVLQNHFHQLFCCLGYAGQFYLEKDRLLFDFRPILKFLTLGNWTLLPGQIGQQFSHLRWIVILDGTMPSVPYQKGF